MTQAGLPVEVVQVVEDKKRGLVALLKKRGEVSDAMVRDVLGGFSNPWDWLR